jgi:hypothetical protein
MPTFPPTLPENVNTLERYKFMDLGGEVAVRTSATGTFKFSGLSIEGRLTEVELSDSTWTALPPTALTNRNSISIQNNSGVQIKINYVNTNPNYFGVIIESGCERFYDINDNIIIYAKASLGSPKILIEELA